MSASLQLDVNFCTTIYVLNYTCAGMEALDLKTFMKLFQEKHIYRHFSRGKEKEKRKAADISVNIRYCRIHTWLL